MKALINVPLLILALLIGPMTLMGQSSKEKKINRELKKIEKASQKLQELQGIDYMAIAAEAGSEVMVAQRESMREQRRAMEEQRQAMNEQRQAMKEQAMEIQESTSWVPGDLKELKEIAELKQMRKLYKLDKMNGIGYAYGNTPRHFSYSIPAVASVPHVSISTAGTKIAMPEFAGNVYSIQADNENNLTINKTLTDETNTADFNYEVKSGTEGLSLNINGAIDGGKVVITIKRPNGEVYNEYTLSSLANVDLNQSIKFEDQEESQYVGKWVVTVAADKAKGTYSVRIAQ